MTTTTLRRVVTYERVSSEDQRERATIKTQQDELAVDLSKEPNVRLGTRYIDDGVSGTIPMALRPAGKRLLADAGRGLPTALIDSPIDAHFNSVSWRARMIGVD